LAAPKEGSTKTKEISRSHKIILSQSNLVTLTGGKWTTFRKMGEDTVEFFTKITGQKLSKSLSAKKHLYGYTKEKGNGHLAGYGSDAFQIEELMKIDKESNEKLHPDYPYTVAEVVWAVRNEMAIKVEDVLSRRIRILILDAKAAIQMAPKVAAIIERELGGGEDWIQKELVDFYKVAEKYVLED
jgi:glycerol-3-phosphate dehydrogenase